MTNQDQSCLRFSLEESIWFQKGQEVSELFALSIEPNVSISERNQYVVIEGSLLVTGEYKGVNESHEWESESDYNQLMHQRYIQNVIRREDDGTFLFHHVFPVDISIPTNRIVDRNAIEVDISSFDYNMPENSCIKLMAELIITGIYDGEQVQYTSGEYASAEDRDVYYEIPLEESVTYIQSESSYVQGTERYEESLTLQNDSNYKQESMQEESYLEDESLPTNERYSEIESMMQMESYMSNESLTKPHERYSEIESMMQMESYMSNESLIKPHEHYSEIESTIQMESYVNNDSLVEPHERYSEIESTMQMESYMSNESLIKPHEHYSEIESTIQMESYVNNDSLVEPHERYSEIESMMQMESHVNNESFIEPRERYSEIESKMKMQNTDDIESYVSLERKGDKESQTQLESYMDTESFVSLERNSEIESQTMQEESYLENDSFYTNLYSDRESESLQQESYYESEAVTSHMRRNEEVENHLEIENQHESFEASAHAVPKDESSQHQDTKIRNHHLQVENQPLHFQSSFTIPMPIFTPPEIPSYPRKPVANTSEEIDINQFEPTSQNEVFEESSYQTLNINLDEEEPVSLRNEVNNSYGPTEEVEYFEESTNKEEVVISQVRNDQTSVYEEQNEEIDVEESIQTNINKRRIYKEEDQEAARPKAETGKLSVSLTDFFAKKETQSQTRLKVCIVQSGESLSDLASRYEVSKQDIIVYNNLDDESEVQGGKVLYIPQKAIHK